MDLFTCKIELGNAAMEEPEHIAEALEHVAQKLRRGYTIGPIRDLNGNTVGQYKIT